MIPGIVLAAVFFLVAVRRIGRFRFGIWQIMLLGAVVVLATGQITPPAALRAVNPDVMLFLFGVFVIGRALEESGYLSRLTYRLFRRAGSLDSLVLAVIFIIGTLSALLMNDTLAIIGTPVVLSLAKKSNYQPKVLLLALAFAVTTGSVMSPIGNPQNLVIALGGDIGNPFITFIRYLALPTLVNLFLVYGVLRVFFFRSFSGPPPIHSPEPVADPKLAKLSRASLVLLVVLIVFRIVAVTLNLPFDFRLTWIALVAALPVLLFSRKRFDIVRRIDWTTLVFFAAMFVLMESVWETGIFQRAIDDMALDLTSHGVILGFGIAVSQFISNVPLVVLSMPVLVQAGGAATELMVLAAGSTIAGNLTILGAASNVIIIQNAEKKAGQTLGFLEFVKVGAPLTLLQAGVYWLFFTFM